MYFCSISKLKLLLIRDFLNSGFKVSFFFLFQAAAGLCVGVGSFSDPRHIPGMAHFLEHMVFMGSEKFPEENDFDSFIKVNRKFSQSSLHQ